MDLSVQLYSIIISFLFGGMFSLELIFFNKLIDKLVWLWKSLFSFLFVMINATIYFILLLFVNNGILHIYFFLSMILGYCIFNFLFTLFRKKS